MDQSSPAVEQAGAGVRLDRVIAELRQWHVFRVAAAYGVAAWLLVQVVATVGPAFDLPDWVLRAVVLAAIVGFLATMAFMLFRPRSAGRGKLQVYLSRRTRIIAGAAVLAIAALAGIWSVRELGAREEVALAVLPFTDLSPSHDKAFFAEGVAEEILSSLSAEKGIKVLGRTSARQIERDSDPKAIRASLGVTHLLEGSARTAGDALRVNVRLVDTSDGSNLWEEEYDGKLADIFSVQDKIAASVVRRLRGSLLSGAVVETQPTSIDAYQSYLAARAILRANKAEAVKRANLLARQIVAAHPDYAPGHALLAETIIQLTSGPYGYGGIPRAKAIQIGLPHAREAIRLAPQRAEGHAALGLYLPREQGIAEYRKALELDPSRTDVRFRMALALDVLQRPDAAFEQYKLAAELDPLSPAIVNRYIQILAASGHSDEAFAVVDKFAIGGGPPAQAWRFRGAILGYRGELARSLDARRRALQIDPGLPYQHDWLVATSHFLGVDDRASSYRSGATPYLQLFVADDRGALKQRLLQAGAAGWDENGSVHAIFSLGRARDWPSLIRTFDVRPADARDFCSAAPSLSPLFILALHYQGRSPEAQQLMQCKQRQVSRLLALPWRSPDLGSGELEAIQAGLLAIRNDRRALDWLGKAVDRGWIGQYYSSQLADWPQFDSLRSDPRCAALQKRIDSTIARERAKVLAGR